MKLVAAVICEKSEMMYEVLLCSGDDDDHGM